MVGWMVGRRAAKMVVMMEMMRVGMKVVPLEKRKVDWSAAMKAVHSVGS